MSRAMSTRCAPVGVLSEAAGRHPLSKTVGLVLIVCLAACAHVEPALVTRDSIVATDKALVATAVVMNAIHPRLNDAQWATWQAFEQRFKTSFHAARVLYDDAIAAQLQALAPDGGSGDPASAAAAMKAAESVLDSLAAQLGYWQGVAAQFSRPDGGMS